MNVKEIDTMRYLFRSTGEMAQRVRDFDWASTPLGKIEQWPLSLRSSLSICLNSNFPIALYWGKDLVLIYNDAWSSIPGNKHPWALGKPAREVWPDIWSDIEPQFDKAFKGEPGGSNDALLPMQRHGYTEECYFDFTFTPVFGQNGKVDGVFNAVIETTYRVINERRISFLQRFSNSLVSVQSFEELYSRAVKEIESNEKDIPFSFLYSLSSSQCLFLNGTEGITEPKLRHDWPFEELHASGQSVHILDIAEYLFEIPKGPWPELPKEALLCPVKGNDGSIVGFSVFGISSRRVLDSEYRSFLESVCRSMSSVVNTISSLEEQRKRAEALAEIDRAKTIFFSNISHEFRTPLTLMLGSLEDLLAKPEDRFDNAIRAALDTTHRNALRLLRLVNNLLDFSRIEAGREKAKFQLTDISLFTKELASNFTSLMETAGLTYDIDIKAIGFPVYVDREMWEKIVLNLLSNAFKYTLAGGVSISLTQEGSHVLLKVRDSGVGIPKHELPKMFHRFHRVEGTTGRTYEGTGIGLSLVNELVKFHGGKILVDSEVGVGSEFSVYIPSGKDHLPKEQMVNENESFIRSSIIDAFMEEASLLIGDPVSNKTVEFLPGSDAKNNILVVDDNADMRSYLKSLLHKKFNVTTANNGAEALKKIKDSRPDIVISDIMMPVLDGVELVKQLKNDPATKDLPILLLSARAGEEAKIEGYETGADDYLVKPFSAKELVSRINAHLNLSKSRKETEEKLRNVVRQAPVAMTLLRGRSFIIEVANDKALEVWGRKYEDVINRPVFDVFPELISQGFNEILQGMFDTGRAFIANEMPVELIRQGKTETLYINFIYEPWRKSNGEIDGIIAIGVDVSEQVAARRKVEESEMELKNLSDAMPQLVCIADADGKVIYYNSRVAEFAGAKKLPDGTWNWEQILHPEDLDSTANAWNDALKKGAFYQKEHRLQMKDGTYRWHLTRAIPQKDDRGGIKRWYATSTDIHDAKVLSEKIRENEERYATTIYASDLGLWDFDVLNQKVIASGKMAEIMGLAANDDYTIDKAFSLIYPDDREEQAKLYNAIVNNEIDPSFLTEYRIIQQNSGAVRWIRARGKAFIDKNGTLYRTVGTVIDITAQKEAELAVKQSEENFRQLADLVPQIIWTARPDGYLDYYNKRWYEFTGFEEEYGDQSWMPILHPDDVQPCFDAWYESVRTGKPYQIEYRFKDRFTGGYRWFLGKALPIRNSSGEITKWFGTCTDIHGQKTMSESLEHLVKERTKELQRSNEDLQQFAHVASHDLKEPVRKIRTFTHRLKDEFGDLLNERAKGYIGKVESATDRMYNMIEGVLIYSTINASEQKIESVDLNEVIHNIENDLEILIHQKSATIKTSQLPLIEGASILIYQLFYNLINNSLKFSQPGIPPSISIRAQRLEAKGKEFAKIIIEDNGIGFEYEFAEKIFETFTRLNSKDKYEGTGLGLALCKKIAERHGGSITASAREGEGATFTVILPLKQHLKII